MNIEQYARDYGLTEPYTKRLQAVGNLLEQSAQQDRNTLQSQLNTQLADYEKYRKEQDAKAVKEGQNAYIDYAKAINPFGAENNNRYNLGLGNSGLSESYRIGANNDYQNRVTDVITNRDKIFADINNNIAKARETYNIELAKVEKAKQDRFLENLYQISAENEAEKERQRQLALSYANLARKRSQGGPPDEVPLGKNDRLDKNVYDRLFTGARLVGSKWQNSNVRNAANENTEKAIYNALNNGQITLEQSETLLKIMQKKK